jgi:glutathione S-transferase
MPKAAEESGAWPEILLYDWSCSHFCMNSERRVFEGRRNRLIGPPSTMLCRVMVAGPITFYDWSYSPFCMKVRAILDYKSVAYESVNPLKARGLLSRRGTGKVPAIEIDGELICDSTDIAHALDARWPDPPLLPEDPRQRGLCHAIEDWADESLYFIGLYYRWHEAEGRKPIPRAFGKSLSGRIAYRFYLRRILGQLRGQGTLRKSPEHVRRDLERHLDAVVGLLTPGPFVLGERPCLADFALWGQLNYLSKTPVGGEAIGRRPAIGAYIERIAGKHASQEIPA